MSLDTNAFGATAAIGTRGVAATASRRPAGKAVFDRVFAAFLLLFLAPVLATVAAVILIADGRPVFYGHPRIGKNGRSFRCLKFRTMVRDGDSRLADVLEIDPVARDEWESARKLERDPRVRRWGQILRKLSLDELPQLINILRGEMSVVGPRPITRDETRYYGRHIADYMAVRPGLTGAWQVGGRNDTSYDERVALDVDYVANRNFLTDLRIILKTVPVAIFGRGAS